MQRVSAPHRRSCWSCSLVGDHSLKYSEQTTGFKALCPVRLLTVRSFVVRLCMQVRLAEMRTLEAAEYTAWAAKTQCTVQNPSPTDTATTTAEQHTGTVAEHNGSAEPSSAVFAQPVAGQALPWGFPPRLAARALGVHAVLRTLSLCLHLMPFAPQAFLRALALRCRNPLMDEVHCELLRVLHATHFKGQRMTQIHLSMCPTRYCKCSEA